MRLRDVPDILLATLLVTGVALVAAQPASAGNSFGDEIEGTYEAVSSKSTARKRIDKQIEKVVQEMPFYKRPFARNQLQESTTPCETLTFGYDSDEISIQCDDDKPAVAKPDGTRTSYTEADGDTHRLTMTVHSDRVVQVFTSDNGSRTNTYRLGDEGTLVMSVRLESSQLPEPITYTRAFKRE